MVKQYRKERNRINKTEEILIKITFLFLFKIFNFLFIYPNYFQFLSNKQHVLKIYI